MKYKLYITADITVSDEDELIGAKEQICAILSEAGFSCIFIPKIVSEESNIVSVISEIESASDMPLEEKPKKKQGKKNLEKKKELEELFNLFWEAYPRKVAKSEAKKAFIKLAPDKEFTDMMISALAQASFIKEESQFIPHASTWINGRRWEDKPDEVKNSPEDEDSFDIDEFFELSTRASRKKMEK